MGKASRLPRAALLAAAFVGVLAPVEASSRPLTALQEADARVLSAGWKLATGNARFCAKTAPVIGLLLQDVATYHDPAGARVTLGLTSDVAVEAVADGSPAQAAGLEANAALLAVAGRPVAALPAVKRGDWGRLAGLDAAIEAALVRDGRVTLTTGQGAVTVEARKACAVRFVLDDRKGGATATPARVTLGRKLYDEMGGDEDMVAAVLAHELAHAVLDHQGWLDGAGRSARNVRRTEDEADRLSVWLLANAGYEPVAALRFMTTFGPRHEGLFAAADHGRWKDRAARMAAELDVLRTLPASAEIDWPRYFRRGAPVR